MQGAKDHVASFRGRQRQANGFQVPHLTDKYGIRILTGRGSKGLIKTQRISMNLTLVDQAFFALMDKFDGVLNGKNVTIPGLIDVINHRCERSRFTGTGRPGDQAKAAGVFGDILEYSGRTQLLQAENF